jgi:biopolymer transport protein ExbB
MNSGSAQTTFSLVSLFFMGGVFMWPLLAFSVAAVALSFERAAYLLYHSLRLDDLAKATLAYLKADDAASAAAYLQPLAKRRIGARILLVLVRRANLSERRLEKAVEAEALSCISRLENGCGFLTAIGSLAPLTGFLGTVSGMIGAFKSISEAAEVSAQIVADGIYEALITTEFGLIIAIVALTVHSLVTHAIDRFAAETEKTCSELIAEIAVHNEAGAANTEQSATAEAI